MFSIVDLETTGGKAGRDRITEVAIINFDGENIEEEFSSLINPERKIPSHITRLTGITESMVADAPKFYEVAKKIVEMTKGRTFVAHNVGFDYNFLKHEFADLGYTFSLKKLCTVRLARKALPGHPSYSLGKICERLGIALKNRHRALGDARATTELFKLILEKSDGAPEELTSKESSHLLLPPRVNKKVIEALPEKPGVYYFVGERGIPLYIGKSKNIKARVITHLQRPQGKNKRMEFRERITDIRYRETGSEFLASILEILEIKKERPEFNTVGKRIKFPYGLFLKKGSFEIKSLHQQKDPLIYFGTRRSGEKYLESLKEQYGLGDNTPEVYIDSLVQKLIKENSYPADDFVFFMPGRVPKERSFLFVEGGVFQGHGFVHENMIDNPSDLKNFLVPAPEFKDLKNLMIKGLNKHYYKSENQLKILS